jgi:hypothetical protein
VAEPTPRPRLSSIGDCERPGRRAFGARPGESGPFGPYSEGSADGVDKLGVMRCHHQDPDLQPWPQLPGLPEIAAGQAEFQQGRTKPCASRRSSFRRAYRRLSQRASHGTSCFGAATSQAAAADELNG